MARNFDLPILEENPQHILDVPQDANAADIRTAYLNKIKEYPPETCPAEFEKIRDAYKILSDPNRRMRMMLLSVDPEAPLMTLLDHQEKNRQFVGPEAWLAAMRER